MKGKAGEWSSQTGRIDDANNGVSPTGEWMLIFDPSSQTIANQVVAIDAALSKKLASGKATLLASAHYNTSSQVGGTAFLRVNFLSAEKSSQNLPSLSESLVLDSDPKTWEKIELSAELPENAAFIVFRVAFDADSLDLNPGHVDETNLTITVTP